MEAKQKYVNKLHLDTRFCEWTAEWKAFLADYFHSDKYDYYSDKTVILIVYFVVPIYIKCSPTARKPTINTVVCYSATTVAKQSQLSYIFHYVNKTYVFR